MNADPRRPDKVQRYVAKNANSGEDLTPDYMNIMGQHTTTGNAAGEAASDKQSEPPAGVEQNLHGRQAALEDMQNDVLVVTSNAANVIPTSPQYGVAIIPNNNGTELPAVPVENNVNPTTINETPTEPVPPKPAAEETKDVHSTPSRNDRFKVVKIASLEPFKRGRWKCMDYVDEAPPPSVVNNPINKPAQSLGNNMVPGGYMQSQSLPQQQIQQMIMQGGYTNGGQFIPNMQQMIPQGQYFYPQVANVPNQNMPQQIGSSMPAQFMNNQQYFPAGVVTNPQGYSLPQSYQNIQYMPMQNSAFVPTSQTMQMPNNYQQGQTYGGQSNVTQNNMTQPQMMNGHAYPPPHESQQMNQQPNQAIKNVVNSMPQQNLMQQQPMPNHPQQHQQPVMQQQQQQQQQYQPQSGTYQPGASMTQPQQNTHQSQTNVQSSVIAPIMAAPSMQSVQQVPPPHQVPVQQQSQIDNVVYNNPQFSNSANSVTVVANSEIAPSSGAGADVPETNSVAETTVSESADDPSKGAVVNAIDNKIEQAMDLVKSHLMYTVREEVEVLKEKISELMEKIQQLETENNYLRSQIPKTQPALPPVQNVAPVYNSPVPPQPQNMVHLQQNVIPPVNQMPQIPQGNAMGTVNVPAMPQHQPQSIPQQNHPQQSMPHPQTMPLQQHQGILPPQQHSVIPSNTAIPQSYDKAPNE